MRIYQRIRMHCEILGISLSCQSVYQEHIFKTKIFLGFLLLGGIIVSETLYILYEASGFTIYVECISMACDSITSFTYFSTVVFAKNLLFESIGNIEQLIDASE